MVEDANITPDDAQLISLAKAGDVEAFGQLYTRYLEQIYRYIRLRVDDDRVAEDLTEDVFLRAFNALEPYEERGLPFSSFLFRVTKNLLTDHYRRQAEEVSLEDADRLPAKETGLDEKLIADEMGDKVRRALGKLPDEYQEVIRLRIVLGIPTPTAAAWMGRSEGALRVLLHRALKALRKKMIEHDG